MPGGKAAARKGSLTVFSGRSDELPAGSEEGPQTDNWWFLLSLFQP